MASGESGAFRQVQTLFRVGTLAGRTDAELLEQFVSPKRDAAEVAFETLMERHGPMVLRVCRSVLGNPHAAEDAFQATFLVLARKAGGIGRREQLGNWLYGVAYRTAMKARTSNARRRRHESQAAEMTREALEGDRNDFDLAPMLHEELNRLPQAYRVPVVLCHLEGISYEAAARQLRVTESTVRGRLARARSLLKDRLSRRGVALTSGLGVMASSRGATAVPTALLARTVQAAMAMLSGRAMVVGAVSTSVAMLTGEILRTMIMNKMKSLAAGLFLSAGLVVGVGWLTHRVLAKNPQTPQPRPSAKAIPAGGDKTESDREAIRGTWTMEIDFPLVIDGEPQPLRKLKETWVISDDRIVTAVGEEALKEGFAHERVIFYTLAPDQTPKSIDLQEPGWGTFPGIYKLDGDELTICYDVGERPTSFTSQGLITVSLKRVSPDPRPITPLFATAPGGYWAVHPGAGGQNQKMTTTIGGVLFMTETTAADGALQMTLAHPVKPGRELKPEYRPVAFDSDRKRYLPEPGMGGSSGAQPGATGVALQRFRLDPKVLPAEKVAYLGVEMVTPEGLFQQADQANERAKAAGVEVLPPPRIGSDFAFHLTTMDGQTIRSKELKGKVVLIDCWASWCSPCMAEMPRLKALYEKHHDDGFEIIGVCFDADIKKARKAIERTAILWPQVLVPDDEEVRDLWAKGSMIEGWPRLLLLDRKGILRVDCAPEDVEEQVIRWLEASRDQP